jgi:hypothetical protein
MLSCLSGTRFREPLGVDYFTIREANGVEDHDARSGPALAAVAFDFEGLVIVGENRMERALATKLSRHLRTFFSSSRNLS